MSERLRLDALPWQPWKNGAGRTREIAREPAGAGFDDFGWRLSLAEVAADAPFSAFPGVDRVIVLLEGDGLTLCHADGRVAHELAMPNEPWAFDGGLALQARLRGGPTRDLNLMLRRGRWRGVLHHLVAPATLGPADASMLLVLDGAPRVGDTTLRPGEAWLERGGHDDLVVTGTGHALAARLWIEVRA